MNGPKYELWKVTYDDPHPEKFSFIDNFRTEDDAKSYAKKYLGIFVSWWKRNDWDNLYASNLDNRNHYTIEEVWD